MIEKSKITSTFANVELQIYHLQINSQLQINI